eukprot:TRINITY_DN2560_c0_g1_i6.p2 TRINITY_DN2560_c0_g1~~TRINITY_DN2560_c0_g1_i6.p2  ORF type:complete len:117 (+),score=37.90 TRINITY_DN2560_c0_g1_i6:218-568(+)
MSWRCPEFTHSDVENQHAELELLRRQAFDLNLQLADQSEELRQLRERDRNELALAQHVADLRALVESRENQLETVGQTADLLRGELEQTMNQHEEAAAVLEKGRAMQMRAGAMMIS